MKLHCQGGSIKDVRSLSNHHELGELEDNRGRQRSIQRAGLDEVEDNRGRQRSLNRAGGRVNYNSHYYSKALGEVEDSQRRAEIMTGHSLCAHH